MRAQEFVTDEINKQVFSPGWTDETTILNRYVLKARAADDWNKYQKLDIDVFDPESGIPYRIAHARFRIKPGFFFQKNLEASMIYVSQEYQKRGIATAIYQYVRKLGNTIKPSRFQLPAGKSMWKSFDRTDALAEEFDGPTAAGCIVVAEDTGRWCLQQRSNTVSDPGVWSTWGGGREPGETVTETVLRELAEESGYRGITKLELIDTNQDYATFLAHVPREFEPEINSECQDWRWSEPDNLPEPLHPGLLQTLSKNFETFNNVVSKQGVAEAREKFNQAIMRPGFKFSQEINGVTYEVTNDEGYGPVVTVTDENNKVIGQAAFLKHKTRPGLESLNTYVEPYWQGQGIATTMYAVMRLLGANISPSTNQTDDGRDMWDKWEKHGDAKHIKTLNSKIKQQDVSEGKHPGKSVVDAIQKVLPVAQEIWFHGSRATGKHRRNSDTDILVVVPDDLVGDQYLAVVRILQKLSSMFDNYDIQPTKAGNNIHRIAQEEGRLLWSNKQGVAENFADDKVNEDSFTNNFSQIDSIITKQYPKEIMNLLLGMFPTAKEAIVNQYNDEDGMPFSEWRRAIYEIDNYILSGPVVVDGAKLPINPEIEADRLAKYQQYIKDKDSGQPTRYFRANDSDPRTIDFTKLSPITIAQTDRGMEVADGNHRAFLAKMANKPLRAFVWTKQKNNHPNVAKIKSLFQEINENFADGKVKGKSRPGRVRRAGASCDGSVTDLRARAKKASGERAKMYHWCANMKSGKKKNK